jgi:hypothetical protein
MNPLKRIFAVAILAMLAMISAAAPHALGQEVVGPGYTHLHQSGGYPWQLAWDGLFTSSSTATAGFDTRGISYYRVLWYVQGTVGSCSLSIDSAVTLTPVTGALASPVIGGIVPAASIGSCAVTGSYVTPSAAGVAPYGQITPTIVGSGSVIVILFGYTDPFALASASSGSSSGTIVSPVDGSGNVKTDLETAIPAGGNNIGGVTIQNVTAVTGPVSITSTQVASVTAGGASEGQITVTGTWTGTLTPKMSGDGTNYLAVLVHAAAPNGPWQSSITANGVYAVNVAANQSLEVAGNTVATGTALVTVVVSPGIEDVTVSGLNTPADGAATPVDAVHDQSWPMGWNGAGSDRLRTAGVGNTVAATGLLAVAPYCEFLTALPTLTTGTYGAVQCDAKGQQFTDLNYVLGAIMSATNPIFIRKTDGTTSVAACVSAYGTAPTGTECDAENAFITNVVATQNEPGGGALYALTASSQSALTTAVVVKASTGNLYGFQITNGAATVCYLEFINVASAPSLGTGAVYSFQIPASGTVTITPSSVGLSNFATGISVGMSTTYNGASACGTAATAVIFYK